MTDIVQLPTQHPEIPFPIGRDAPFALPAVYAETLQRDRHTKVRMSDGSQAWFFHRHDDVRALMLHPGLSSDRSARGFPAISTGGKAAFRHFSPINESCPTIPHRLSIGSEVRHQLRRASAIESAPMESPRSGTWPP